jgi:hypothetical protein
LSLFIFLTLTANSFNGCFQLVIIYESFSSFAVEKCKGKNIQDYNFARGSIWVTLREEHKMKVFENRLMWGIFSPKRVGVTRGWRKLHNEELHN